MTSSLLLPGKVLSGGPDWEWGEGASLSVAFPTTPSRHSSLPKTQPRSYITDRSNPLQKEKKMGISVSVPHPPVASTTTGKGALLRWPLYKCPVKLFILTVHFLGLPSAVNCPQLKGWKPDCRSTAVFITSDFPGGSLEQKGAGPFLQEPRLGRLTSGPDSCSFTHPL